MAALLSVAASSHAIASCRAGIIEVKGVDASGAVVTEAQEEGEEEEEEEEDKDNTD